MTDRAKVESVTIDYGRRTECVSWEGKGLLSSHEQYSHPGSLWKIPDSVGHSSLIVDGNNIGAIRTPYQGNRVQIVGQSGVAVVSQLDSSLSVAVQLAPEGALRLALKLIQEVMRPYGGICAGEDCPPKLKTAFFALHDAEHEARFAREPLR